MLFCIERYAESQKLLTNKGTFADVFASRLSTCGGCAVMHWNSQVFLLLSVDIRAIETLKNLLTFTDRNSFTEFFVTVGITNCFRGYWILHRHQFTALLIYSRPLALAPLATDAFHASGLHRRFQVLVDVNDPSLVDWQDSASVDV